jgi:hypothetical protein
MSVAEALERYVAQPEVLYRALFREHVNLSLNPGEGGITLRTRLVRSGRRDVVERFMKEIATQPHALYEVRRMIGVNTAKSVITIAKGTFPEMVALMGRRGAVSIEYPVCRVYLQQRGDTLPTCDHFLVATPAVVEDSQRADFEVWWNRFPNTRPPLRQP